MFKANILSKALILNFHYRKGVDLGSWAPSWEAQELLIHQKFLLPHEFYIAIQKRFMASECTRATERRDVH